jgi:cobalamin biosynthesis protein CobW
LFEDQLAAADLVLLNKTDQMDHMQKEHTHQLLACELPESVKVIETHFGRVNLDILLGMNAASERYIHNVEDHHSKYHADGTVDHDHDDFDSINIELENVELEKLLALLDQLVDDNEIFRIKGFLHMADKPMRCVLQAVGRRFDHYYDRVWKADEIRTSKLVFIGHELDEARLKSTLASMLPKAA